MHQARPFPQSVCSYVISFNVALRVTRAVRFIRCFFDNNNASRQTQKRKCVIEEGHLSRVLIDDLSN